MTQSKRRSIYWVLKISSIIISCAFPAWGIFEQFPIWQERGGTGRSVGVGFILLFVVVIIVFHKSVFKFIEERLKLKHAPPLMIWLALIVLTLGLIWLSSLMADMINIYILGFIGCLIGNVLTFIGEHIGKNGE